MPLGNPSRLKEWLHFHNFTAISLADKIKVSRQTVAKIVRKEFESVNVKTIQAIVDHTGLTWEDICSEVPTLTHRRSGNRFVDEILSNLIRDLHEENTVRRYKKYISKDFQCTSPHYFQAGLARVGELWHIDEGQTINGEVIDYSKGWVDWPTMCRYNRPEQDSEDGELVHPDRFVNIESIDIICTPDTRPNSKEVLLVSKSIWHEEQQLRKMPLTMVRLTFENTVVEASIDLPPKIVSWWWCELPTI
jgi:transcriptional regulator with XRE-family HTH domain